MKSMQYMFTNLYNMGSSHLFNNELENIAVRCLENITDQRFIAGGYIVAAQDSFNDIIEYCDYKNVKQHLRQICKRIVQFIAQNLLVENSRYTEEQVEMLSNNFGGTLQVVIVRLERNGLIDPYDGDLKEPIVQVINECVERAGHRQGVLLMYNGLMNTLTPEEIDSMAPKIITLIG